MDGKPLAGYTAEELRARGWVVRDDIPDRAAVVGSPELMFEVPEGFSRRGVFQWENDDGDV